MLRIAMISEHASPLATIGGVDAGGQNVYVNHVARRLARSGHRVDVLTRRDRESVAPVVELEPGVRVVHVEAGPSRYVAKERLLTHMGEFAQNAESVLRCEGPYDVLHAHFFMSGWVAQRLRRALSLPFVMTFHALGLVRLEHQRSADAFPPERVEIERQLVQVADRVIAECPQDRADLERLYDADPRRIATVPCGVDLAEFVPMDRAEARQSLGWSADDFVVLQLGRLVPRKGIDNVILALAKLPSTLKARLVVVGGSDDESDEATANEVMRLKTLTRECGVEDKVTFAGHRHRAELRRFYCAADVFATTPWYEPFGITPLEAMACGTPVVGSDVGGIKHSVIDGVTGYLVPPRDPEALADRIARLHAHPTVARAMGEAGMLRVRTQFTWERVARGVAQAYADAIAQAGVAVPVVQPVQPIQPMQSVRPMQPARPLQIRTVGQRRAS